MFGFMLNFPAEVVTIAAPLVPQGLLLPKVLSIVMLYGPPLAEEAMVHVMPPVLVFVYSSTPTVGLMSAVVVTLVVRPLMT